MNDVVHDGDAVLLRLGEPPSPVPAPVAALLREHIATRANMNTATIPTSRWIFPGLRNARWRDPRECPAQQCKSSGMGPTRS